MTKANEPRNDNDGRDDRFASFGAGTTRLMKLVEGRLRLFTDHDRNPYVQLSESGHKEVHALNGATFREWLERTHYRAFGAAPSATIDKVLDILKGEARFDSGEPQTVAVRLWGDDASVYLDLGDPAWHVVRVTAEGWNVLPESPVLFRRPNGTVALPFPEKGGSVDELRPFLNVRDEGQFRMIIGFLLGALRPRPPYPLLELTGLQGSAKSTTARLLRQLIDPSSTPARAPFRNEQELAIAANNAWMLVFDNLSRLSGTMSDGLCRMSTGGGFGARKLYTDDQEQMFNVARPVILNGIEDIATRPDLLDRTLSVELLKIAHGRRRVEGELIEEFHKVRPRVLGALLDAVARALGRYRNLPEYEWPRMADFAQWVTAAEPTLGWASGSFVELMRRNRIAASQRARDEHDMLITALQKLLSRSSSSWRGSSTDLLNAINSENSTSLPRAANALSGLLKRLSPALVDLGIQVEWPARNASQRFIEIRAIAPAEILEEDEEEAA